MDEDESLLSRAERSVLGPLFYNITVLAMKVGFAVALLAAAYLIYGLFSGQLSGYATLPHPDRLRILSNISLATQVLTGGLALGSLAAAYVLWGEDFVGYGMVVGSALVGIGVPQAYALIGGDTESSNAVGKTLGAFPQAMMAPLVIGGVLVARDVVYRLIRGFQEKPIKHEKMTYGSGAATETRHIRTSLFAKCWEGPYCREFIRVHCPIYQKRQACWREKRGCYCEETIVSGAASKVNGLSLDMAPDPKLNFANPPSPAVAANDPLASPGIQLGGIGSGGGIGAGGGLGGGLGGGYNLGAQPQIPRKIVLSMAQKRERCRNCVIYNEHQREKYKILMPVVLLATLVLCAVFAEPVRDNIGNILAGVDRLLAQISFNSGGGNAATNLWKPSAGVEWVLIGALALMLISKVLQVMEWAIFKIKI
jgi:hypothetical protein